MKFSTILSAAALISAAVAQDSAAPADITLTETVTVNPATVAAGTVSGVPVSVCGPGALCPTDRITDIVDVWPYVTTKIIPEIQTVQTTVSQKVVKVIVQVTSIPVATRGLCPTKSTRTHSTTKTIPFTSTTTSTAYYVVTTESISTRIETEYYTRDDACTIPQNPLAGSPSAPASGTTTPTHSPTVSAQSSAAPAEEEEPAAEDL